MEWLNLLHFFFFFFLILYFILYVCTYFCSVSNHLDQNQLYQGFHVWGQEGEQTEVRKRTSGSLVLWSAGMLMLLTQAIAFNVSVIHKLTQTDILFMFVFCHMFLGCQPTQIMLSKISKGIIHFRSHHETISQSECTHVALCQPSPKELKGQWTHFK